MRTNCVILGLLILTSFGSLNAVELNEGLSILVKAYQNSGFNPNLIRTGVAEFEKTIDRQNENPALVAIYEESHRKNEEMVREQHKGDEKTIALELKRIRDSYEESRRRIIQERVKILMSGNDRTYGGEPGEKYKRRYERHEFIPSLAQWIHTSIDLTFGTLIFFSPDIVKSQLHVGWVPNNQDLIIDATSQGFGEFQEFGRFRESVDSRVAHIIQQKIDRETFALPADFQEFSENEIQEFGLNVNITGETVYDEGTKAKIIEVKKGDKLLEKYHIDTERGLCPYQYVTTESGDSFIERTAKGYIIEEKTGLYYPQSYREIISWSSGADKIDTQWHLVPNTLRLNHPVSDAEFTIDIPEGSRVADFRERDKPVRYVAMNNGTISLAKGGYDLDQMRWLQIDGSIESSLTGNVPSTGGASDGVRWLLMGIGIVLILIALGRRAFYQIWKKS